MNPVFLLSPPLSNLVPLYQKLPPFWSLDHSLPLRSYAKKNVYPPSIIWKSAPSPLFNFNFKRRMILGSWLHPYIRYQRDAGTCGFSSVLDLSLPKVSRLRDVQWKQMEIMTTQTERRRIRQIRTECKWVVEEVLKTVSWVPWLPVKCTAGTLRKMFT